MRSRVTNSIAAVLTVMLLLLQYVPFNPADVHRHEHCEHCRKGYCTREARTCPHGAAGGQAAHHGAHSHDGHADGHGAHHAVSHSSVQKAPDGGATVEESVRSCGTTPSGILLLTLDKFVPGSDDTSAPGFVEHAVWSVVREEHTELVPTGIFHPPSPVHRAA